MTAAAAPHPLLTAPVASTLARLAAPNLMGMLATTAVSIAETAYIGRLGREPLAAAALVLPLIMLMGMMSGGAMAGGVASSISRALGAGDTERAETLARHGALIALAGGLVFTIALSLFGAPLFHLLGGRGEILRLATLYGGVAFSVSIAVWLINVLAAVLRASGDMVRPSIVMICGAVLQMVVGGSLCFGWGPAPRLGLVGVALGQALTTILSLTIFIVLLRAKDARVRLRFGGPLHRWAFDDILQVGLPALLSPVQTVGAILILTAIAARFGPETLAGYGIGSRLEFLLVPIAFAVGVAALPMVGLAIGAGDVARARRVAWTAGGMGGLGLGSIGIVLALWPQLWVSVFTQDPGVSAAAQLYLRFAGPAFIFFGVNLALYFASQGAGRILGPLLAGTLRLVVIAVGGWLLVRADAPDWTLFALVAAGMVTAGTATAAFVAATPWGPRGRPSLP
ncbi:MATE family efflux transporter [uncultured Phenylobacterium sp.]|uniref:MATE family efflux transporter n=1 Tax=uncultured Phenylobacterium sp. TaxID=349273 RepID=UPI0025E95735|nr:MATE family efflux transporter [uncultured Phenylobacterium sp.]